MLGIRADKKKDDAEQRVGGEGEPYRGSWAKRVEEIEENGEIEKDGKIEEPVKTEDERVEDNISPSMDDSLVKENDSEGVTEIEVEKEETEAVEENGDDVNSASTIIIEKKIEEGSPVTEPSSEVEP